MSIRHLISIAGSALIITGAFMLAPASIAAVYRESDDVVALLGAAVLTLLLGYSTRRVAGDPDEITNREAFAAVAFSWIVVIAAGALPYLFSGALPSPTDAVFESASGFTATGSTVVADPGALSHGILFWRSLTQWLGGMGVIVLVVALIPSLRIGGMHLTSAEAPGPTPERITPRFSATARTLWLLFVGFTVVETVLLVLVGMTPFQAVTHSFTTISGGGFGTEITSMAAFSPAAQWVVVAFMIAGGTSFALHHRGLRRPISYLRDAEFRLFMLVILGASAIVIIGTWGGAVLTTVRDGVFTVVSIITTTGFVTADYGLWIPGMHVLLVGLMFIGAMSGSTSGSVKVLRVEVVARSIRASMRRLVHPRSVRTVSVGGRSIEPLAVSAISSYLLLYLLAFIGGTLALSVIELLSGSGDLGLVSSVSAVATSLGNIGPGLDAVGPTTTFAVIPMFGKWLLALIMVIGRLEILPVLILLNKESWRR
jgi:trk system potassium uptake protein TrkH